MKTDRSLYTSAALVLCVSPLLAGTPAAPDKSPTAVARSGGWRVSGGLMHRSLGGFDWLTGTQSVPSLLTIGPGSNTAGIDAIGPADAFANRTYFDGFVFQDAGTAEGGDTWYWGYDSASQVQSGLINFHGGNGTAATFTASNPLDDYAYGGWSSDLDGTAPYLQLEWVQPYTDSLSFGFQGGISFMNTGASRTLSTFTAAKSRTDYGITYADTYDLMGSQAPQAPYAGGPNGPGILLTNIPMNRVATHTVSGGETATAFNSISTDLDLNLSALSFGPVLEYQRGKFALLASAGLTINIADWDAEQNETLFVSRNGAAATAQNHWTNRDGGTDVLPGFFLQAAVSRELNDKWSLTAFGRYDWVGEVDIHAGPSTGSADLSGWSLGGGIGYRF